MKITIDIIQVAVNAMMLTGANKIELHGITASGIDLEARQYVYDNNLSYCESRPYMSKTVNIEIGFIRP